MISRLEELVLNDRVDEAVAYVSEMNAQHISSLLDHDTMERAPEKFDLFIRRHYTSLESPYARADVAYYFGGVYLTALTSTTNAFFAERDFTLDTLTDVVKQLIEDIRSRDLLVGCPDRVIPPQTFDRLLGYAAQLSEMSFRPTLEESAQHEQETTAWLESIGEDSISWLDMFRTSQLRPIRSSE